MVPSQQDPGCHRESREAWLGLDRGGPPCGWRGRDRWWSSQPAGPLETAAGDTTLPPVRCTWLGGPTVHSDQRRSPSWNRLPGGTACQQGLPPAKHSLGMGDRRAAGATQTGYREPSGLSPPGTSNPVTQGRPAPSPCPCHIPPGARRPVVFSGTALHVARDPPDGAAGCTPLGQANGRSPIRPSCPGPTWASRP